MTNTIHPELNSFKLNKEAFAPSYTKQLYEHLTYLINSKKLKPGDFLPSSRFLANRLEISRNIVVSVYKSLLDEGYLETTNGRGTFVSEFSPRQSAKTIRQKEKIQSVSKVLPKRVRHLKELTSLHPQQSVPFAQIAPDKVSLPGKKWEQVVTRISRSPWLHNGYSNPSGFRPFQEAIAEYLRCFRAVACEPEQVIIINNIQEGLLLCTQALLEANDRVAIEDPGFQLHRELLAFQGAHTVPIKLTDDGIDLEKLEDTQNLKAVLVTACHQYPLGLAMAESHKRELAQWASQKGVWIIEDDYDSELRFNGAPYPPIAAFDTSGSTIYLGSFTKVIYPGFNLGYMVVPKNLIKVFESIKLLDNHHTSEVHQVIVAEFIAGGFYDAHIRRLKNIYEKRRRVAVLSIGRALSKYGKLLTGNQGTHLVFEFNISIDDVKLSEFLLEKYGIETRALSACYVNAKPKSGLILGYAHFDENELRTAAEKLKTAAADFLSR